MLKSLSFVCVFACLSSTMAQTTAALSGRVIDESCAVVPGAKVIAERADGRSKSAEAEADGSYRIVALEPGVYSVQASAPGLSQIQKLTVTLTPGSDGKLDLPLRVALEKQTMTVEENVTDQLSTDAQSNASAL